MANELKLTIIGDASSAMGVLDDFSKRITKAAGDVGQASGALDVFGSGVAQSMAGLGGLAAIGARVGQVLMNGLGKLASIMPDAVASTDQLAATFKGLQITAGMSAGEFNKFNATLELSGGKAEDLTEIVRGMERGIKSNSEVLVANGIAANKAGLSHMTMGEYIAQVVKTMESFGNASDKDQLLMAAFGRGGMAFAAQLVEINKHMAEGEALAKKGGPITAQSIVDLDRHREAMGRLSLAWQVGMAQNAHFFTSIEDGLANMTTAILTWGHEGDEAVDLAERGLIAYRYQLDGTTRDMKAMIAEAQAWRAEVEAETKLGNQDRGREQMHAENASNSFTSKEDLEAVKEARRKAAEAAKKAEAEKARERREEAEVLVNLQGQILRLDAEDAKTLDASTLALKRQREEAEALAKLKEEYARIDNELAKAPTAENMAAAQDANIAAHRAYTDRLLQIKRDTDAEQITQDAATKAALEAAQKKALEDLKHDLAERSLIQGKLSRDETGQALDAYAAKGANEAGAVKQYKLEVHWDEGAGAGALAGLRAFSAQTDNVVKQMEGFTLHLADSVTNGLGKAWADMITKGGSASKKLQDMWKGLSASVVQELTTMAARQLVNWGIEKAIAAWKAAENVQEGVMLTGKTAEQVSAAAAQEAANAGVAASETATVAPKIASATSGFFSAFAGIPFVGLGLALAAIAGMMVVMKSVTGRETGGIIGLNGPEMFWGGEKGPEVIAPPSDFRDWASANQNLGFNLGAHAAQVSRLQSQASGYASSAQAQASSGTGPVHVHLENSTIAGESVDSARVIGNLVKKHMDSYNRRNG
jgi:hypothetical protein